MLIKFRCFSVIGQGLKTGLPGRERFRGLNTSVILRRQTYQCALRLNSQRRVSVLINEVLITDSLGGQCLGGVAFGKYQSVGSLPVGQVQTPTLRIVQMNRLASGLCQVIRLLR